MRYWKHSGTAKVSAAAKKEMLDFALPLSQYWWCFSKVKTKENYEYRFFCVCCREPQNRGTLLELLPPKESKWLIVARPIAKEKYMAITKGVPKTVGRHLVYTVLPAKTNPVAPISLATTNKTYDRWLAVSHTDSTIIKTLDYPSDADEALETFQGEEAITYFTPINAVEFYLLNQAYSCAKIRDPQLIAEIADFVN